MKNSAQLKLLSIRDERAVLSLRGLSARVGSDPLLVQASNGNTSIKLDGILWIKASGKWLAHSMQEEMLVPLKLAEVASCCHPRALDQRHCLGNTCGWT